MNPEKEIILKRGSKVHLPASVSVHDNPAKSLSWLSQLASPLLMASGSTELQREAPAGGPGGALRCFFGALGTCPLFDKFP